MRDGEARLVDDAVAVEEQVEVDRARPPVRAVAFTAEPALDSEQYVEQRPRLELGVDLRNGIQEPRLLLVAPGLRLDDLRHPPSADEAGGGADRRFTVAEVRAEAYVRERQLTRAGARP